MEDVAALGAEHRTVQLDQSSAANAIIQAITGHGGKAPRGPDPIAAMKAIKNDTEIAGSRAAHRRDGAAVTTFLAWFDRTAPSGGLTEIDAVEALETFRRDNGLLKDVSFSTISGSGPNAAIVHYRVTRKTNRRISPGEIFLVDFGAQYQDGTTDITRTVDRRRADGGDARPLHPRAQGPYRYRPRGVPGRYHRRAARRLRPRAAVGGRPRFRPRHRPRRRRYLSVHEGPARISKLGTTPLKRGMILSNEPGYYKVGAYGIRIENLVLVTGRPRSPARKRRWTVSNIDAGADRPAPDRTRALDQGEIAWLDAYHGKVRVALSPLVDEATRAWLAAATAPLDR